MFEVNLFMNSLENKTENNPLNDKNNSKEIVAAVKKLASEHDIRETLVTLSDRGVLIMNAKTEEIMRSS